ncbi:hypothetical protein AtubIFM55763_002203 [Aspergillus tubingensis]|nr:hypothetical protein AtubIFM55763_002203 [Aspergillus tubingensis]
MESRSPTPTKATVKPSASAGTLKPDRTMNYQAENDFASPTNPSSATSTASNYRRTKSMMSVDEPAVKFLYTIMKQLDLRTIDWALVASQLNISNGHAARMRYSRLKGQLENQGPNQKAARPKRVENRRSARASSSRAGATTVPATSYPDFEPFVPIKEEFKEEVKDENHGETMPRMADIPLAPPHAMHPGPFFPHMAYPWGFYYPHRYSMDEYNMYTPMGGFAGSYYQQKHHEQQYLPSSMASVGWEAYKSDPEDEEKKLNEIKEEPVDKGKSVDREAKEELSDRKSEITVIED